MPLMPPILPESDWLSFTTSLFVAAGAPDDEAAIVARELATSSLMGHDSHGLLRVPEYLRMAAEGVIVPGAPVTPSRRSETTAIVDGALNFGQVVASRAIAEGIDIARRHRTACVITRRCHHVGRLGAYVEQAAAAELIAIATCNSPVHGHFVLPWGGREGRLATNPIAYAVPTLGDPIVADISTSVAPEGKIRVRRNTGQPLPEGWALDAAGRPTTDPVGFYGPPRGGILPLGGAMGHKGFALGLLVEVLGSALAGVSPTDPATVGNGVCFLLVDPAAFCPIERFKQLTDELVRYVKSSAPAPGFEEVLVPGELEIRALRRRRIEGLTVDAVTWQGLLEHAARLGVPPPGTTRPGTPTLQQSAS
jgi:uncharacterized oxidoreductase